MTRSIILFMLLWPALTFGETSVEAGNQAFFAKDYAAAASAYRAVLKDAPDSADAWYNLGTAEARAGRFGHAIHALEQSLLLRPDDEDAQHNLTEARSLALQRAAKEAEKGGRVLPPGDDDMGAGLLTSVSAQTLSIVLAISWALIFGLIAGWRRARTPGTRTATSFGAVVAGLFAFGAAGMLIGQQIFVRQTTQAVIVAEIARLHVGPGAQYDARTKIAGGVKVKLRGSDGNWRRVQLPDGSDGWLPSAQVAVLRTP